MKEEEELKVEEEELTKEEDELKMVVEELMNEGGRGGWRKN